MLCIFINIKPKICSYAQKNKNNDESKCYTEKNGIT